MLMTRTQHLELRKMYLSINMPHHVFKALAEKKFPKTQTHRRAEKLLEQLSKKRQDIQDKLKEDFMKLKQETHEAIHFSGDTELALKKIKDLKKMLA
jgi:methylphosphotriester-DNA--protein-cysteine methyltransferase